MKNLQFGEKSLFMDETADLLIAYANASATRRAATRSESRMPPRPSRTTSARMTPRRGQMEDELP